MRKSVESKHLNKYNVLLPFGGGRSRSGYAIHVVDMVSSILSFTKFRENMDPTLVIKHFKIENQRYLRFDIVDAKKIMRCGMGGVSVNEKDEEYGGQW